MRLLRATARCGLHAPLRRFTKPPTPMAGVSRHTRYALPVAWPPARFGGKVGCGPAPSSTRACISPWSRPFQYGREARSARSPGAHTPEQKCAPAAAPRREEGQCSTTGGDWRESTGLVAPGTRSGLAGVVATRLRGVKTHQPFLREEQTREESERNQTRTRKKKAPRTPKEERRLPLQEQSRRRRGVLAPRPVPSGVRAHRRAVNRGGMRHGVAAAPGHRPGQGKPYAPSAASLPPLIGPTHDYHPHTSRPKTVPPHPLQRTFVGRVWVGRKGSPRPPPARCVWGATLVFT